MKYYRILSNSWKNWILIVMSVFIPFVMSCSSEDPVNVSFSDDITPILEAKCIDCHAPGRTPPFLVRGRYYETLRKSKYTTPSKANKSLLYTSLKDDHPKLGLTPGELALFKGWINQGANKN